MIEYKYKDRETPIEKINSPRGKGETVMKYKYIISGFYFAGDERRHFYEIVEEENNSKAMEVVIGRLAWNTSVDENKSFQLDFIHYECL